MKETKIRITYEAPPPGAKLEHVYLERRYLEQLDEWVRVISDHKLTPRETACERRSILQNFIGSELDQNGRQGMWPEIRRGQALSSAGRKIELLTRQVADLEDVNAELLRRIAELEGSE